MKVTEALNFYEIIMKIRIPLAKQSILYKRYFFLSGMCLKIQNYNLHALHRRDNQTGGFRNVLSNVF